MRRRHRRRLNIETHLIFVFMKFHEITYTSYLNFMAVVITLFVHFSSSSSFRLAFFFFIQTRTYTSLHIDDNKTIGAFHEFKVIESLNKKKREI